MKVILISPYFYPRVGGVETHVLKVARGLKALGWTVVIVTTGPSESERIATFEGMRVYRFKRALTFSSTPIGLWWRKKLKRVFKAEQPDLINAHTPVPYLADIAQRASNSIPFVLTYHNDLEKEFLPYRIIVNILNFTLIRSTLKQSTGVIATSAQYVKTSRYLKHYAAKIDVVPPGLDLSRFNPTVPVSPRLRARYDSHRVILFVGSLNKSHQHKGLDTLITAFAQLHHDFPDAKLVVVGKGDGLDMYKSMAAKAGVLSDVEFVGFVDDDMLPQYYKLAWVFVMPSTNRSEGFGMAYMEASAVGTPVVGCNVGGVPYAIRDNETGLLVEPNDVQELQSALRRLLIDEELASRLGEAGAARARTEFGLDLLAARTAEVFTRIANVP